MTQPAENRHQRIERIRRQIAAGTYETPAKLEAAVEAMLQRWAEQGPGDDADD